MALEMNSEISSGRAPGGEEVLPGAGSASEGAGTARGDDGGMGRSAGSGPSAVFSTDGISTVKKMELMIGELFPAGGGGSVWKSVASSSTGSSFVSHCKRRPASSQSKVPPVPIKLFVGRLPVDTTEETLRTMFSQFGPVVDLSLIRDRQDGGGAFKGCAFVRMQSITDADRAIRHLDSAYSQIGSDQEHASSQYAGSLGLQVKYAVGEAERLGLPSSSSGGAAAGIDQAKLFVGSLPRDVKEEDLRELFETFGKVEEVFLMRDDQQTSSTSNSANQRLALANKKSRTGCAFIRFAYKEEALFAIKQLNRKFVMPGSQRAMEVRFAENRRQHTTTTTTSGAGTQLARSSSLSAFSASGGAFQSSVPAAGEDCVVLGAADLFLSGEERNQLKQKQNSLGSCLAAAAASLGLFQKSGTPPFHPAEPGQLRHLTSKGKTGDEERMGEAFVLPSWGVSGTGAGAELAPAGGGGGESSFLMSHSNYSLSQHLSVTATKSSSSTTTTTTSATSADHLASLARAALAQHLSASCSGRRSSTSVGKFAAEGEGKTSSSTMAMMSGSSCLAGGGLQEGGGSIDAEQEGNGSSFMQLKEFLPFQSSSQYKKPTSFPSSWESLTMMAGSGSRSALSEVSCLRSASVSDIRKRVLNEEMIGRSDAPDAEASAASASREESSSSSSSRGSGHTAVVLAAGDPGKPGEKDNHTESPGENRRGNSAGSQQESQKAERTEREGRDGSVVVTGLGVSGASVDPEGLLSSSFLSALKDDGSGCAPKKEGASNGGSDRDAAASAAAGGPPQHGGSGGAGSSRGQRTPNPGGADTADGPAGGRDLGTLVGVTAKLQLAGGGKGGKDHRWETAPAGVPGDTSSRSLSPSNADIRVRRGKGGGGDGSTGTVVPCHESAVQLLAHPPLDSDGNTPNTGNGATCSDFFNSILPPTPHSPSQKSRSAAGGDPLEKSASTHFHSLGKILWGQGGCSGKYREASSRVLPSHQGKKLHTAEEVGSTGGEAKFPFDAAGSREALKRGPGGAGVVRTQSTSAESFDEGFVGHLLGGSFAESLLAAGSTSAAPHSKTTTRSAAAMKALAEKEGDKPYSLKGSLEEQQGGGKREEQDTAPAEVYPLFFPPGLLSHASSSSSSSAGLSGVSGECREGVAGGAGGRVQGSQVHGPPGANVFIFHIPNEWTEQDLLTHFNVYGPVVSARIASDRVSGRNRGFGFVSFSSVQAAGAAVMAMNGFQVNGKRLKVQIKKGEEQYASLFPSQNCSGGGGSVSTPPPASWSSNAYRSMNSSTMSSSTDNISTANAWHRLFGQAPSSDPTPQRGGGGDFHRGNGSQLCIGDSFALGSPQHETQLQRTEDSAAGSSAVAALLQAAVALGGSLSSSAGAKGHKSQQRLSLLEGCQAFQQGQKRVQVEEDGQAAAAAATAALVAALFSTHQQHQEYQSQSSSSSGRAALSSSSSGEANDGAARDAIVGVGGGRSSFSHPNYYFHSTPAGLVSSGKGRSLFATLGKRGDHEGLQTSLEHHPERRLLGDS